VQRQARWVLIVVVAVVVGAVAAALASVASNAATGSQVEWWPSMNDHYLQWLAGSIVGVAASGLLVWWAQRRFGQAFTELLPAMQRPEPWLVDRPSEVAAIVRALCRRDGAGTVGITTAVQGAGGFGKTTMARMVRAGRR
jgi:hypothetical protein